MCLAPFDVDLVGEKDDDPGGNEMVREILASITVAGGLAVSGPAVVPGGSGAGGISGYVVSDVAYEDGGGPGWVTAVRLRLDKGATEVSVRLGKATSWAPCSPGQANQWRCPLDRPVAVSAIRNLRVVASGG